MVDSDKALRYSMELSKSVARPGPEGAVSKPPPRIHSTASLTLPEKKEIPKIGTESSFDDATATKGIPQKNDQYADLGGNKTCPTVLKMIIISVQIDQEPT